MRIFFETSTHVPYSAYLVQPAATGQETHSTEPDDGVVLPITHHAVLSLNPPQSKYKLKKKYKPIITLFLP